MIDLVEDIAAMRRAMKELQLRAKEAAAAALAHKKRMECQAQRHETAVRAVHATLREHRETMAQQLQRQVKLEREAWVREQKAMTRERHKARAARRDRFPLYPPRRIRDTTCAICGRTFPTLMHKLLHDSAGCCPRSAAKPHRDDPPGAFRNANYKTRFPRRHSTPRTSQPPARHSAYDILGIARTATDAEIRAAYRRRLLETHPDKNLDDSAGAQRRFLEVQDAQRLLTNPYLRAELDAKLDGTP
ncbi:hypothetical protein CTAYLR_009520 [Chrysophaeum taylorii]|uniref:J domain-containing protein n=1 Tax=Chrysophaeum taylorii TaxID=2483200 RepID=A0AAD7UJC8_9STRA|nr:hypothetical protein CTAYLR_009520 [Chrysophaeum taylorii]